MLWKHEEDVNLTVLLYAGEDYTEVVLYELSLESHFRCEKVLKNISESIAYFDKKDKNN